LRSMRRAYGDEGLPRDGLPRTLEDTLVERAAVILRGGANAQQVKKKKRKKASCWLVEPLWCICLLHSWQ
jgi:hypothetical protein